ncbi:hypothetical protein K449DRAFT_427680 [Hypoxylon sp. EC38]|nr:hypothetical protein K449DRAFT_427680 [Hypoxylon sp. EC38]
MDAPISSPAMAQRQLPSTTTTATAQSFAPPPPAVPKTPSTDSFIRDLNLVAEAAKRAQMAVLMRDLEAHVPLVESDLVESAKGQELIFLR